MISCFRLYVVKNRVQSITATTYCDGIVVARGGDGAVWDELLLYRRRAPFRLGFYVVLGQVIIVDLVLLIGNLLTEPEGNGET